MLKFLEKYEVALTEGTSLLTCIAFFGSEIMGRIFVEIFNLNKTIGWKWSILNTWIDYTPIFSFLIFVGIYAVINTIKKRTDLILSALHILFITLSTFLFNFWEIDLRVCLFLFCVSHIVFAINVYTVLIHNSNSD
ncbi:hypothetical protein [Ascidiimonas sp. W6]|uniref:hypothetical protein n=1 Tax=Ascidiimonas meishanensis TaxID=3128903 RepID=UPI0030EDD7A5